MGSLASILPLILLVAVFYFLLIRPQQKRQQQHKKLLESIEPGDEVVTIGGMFGDVVDLDDDRILLELYDGSQIEFLRSAVSRRVIAEGGEDELDVSSDSDDEDLVEELPDKDTDKSRSKVKGAATADAKADKD